MQGTIKMFNGDKGFGFIEAKDGGFDLFFHISDIKDSKIQCKKGELVNFDPVESRRNPGKWEAKNLELAAEYKAKAFKMPWAPHKFLTHWASISLYDRIDEETGTLRYPSVLPALAELALPEEWSYGDDFDGGDKYIILRKYLRYTFHRLWKENKVMEVSHYGKNFAAFNTGLVDRLYEPIFALFEPHHRSDRQPWKFKSFCCVNRGKEGDLVGEHFNPLPKAAKYFDRPEEVIFDPDVEISPDWEHIIQDAIKRDRYPIAFLEENCPKGMEVPADASDAEWEDFLDRLVKEISSNATVERRIKNRVDDSIQMAVKRARWNFKTAIPLYYAPSNKICLLLPMGLADDEKVDVALVISRTAAGGYTGETIYHLSWAYEQARLVCRPQSDWLTLDKAAQNLIEDDDDTDRHLD